MKTVSRMVQGEMLKSVGFVTLAFLALFAFIDFVDELPRGADIVSIQARWNF